MDKIVIGVCGKPCSGKSTFIKLLCPRSVEVIDCDRVTKQLIGSYAYEIRVMLGTSDPKEIANIIFQDKEKYNKYTALIWGVMNDYIRCAIEESKAENIILDAPLLMESGMNKHCDIVISFAAKQSRRVEWAKLRGWSEAELKRRDGMFHE